MNIGSSQLFCVSLFCSSTNLIRIGAVSHAGVGSTSNAQRDVPTQRGAYHRFDSFLLRPCITGLHESSVIVAIRYNDCQREDGYE